MNDFSCKTKSKSARQPRSFLPVRKSDLVISIIAVAHPLIPSHSSSRRRSFFARAGVSLTTFAKPTCSARSFQSETASDKSSGGLGGSSFWILVSGFWLLVGIWVASVWHCDGIAVPLILLPFSVPSLHRLCALHDCFARVSERFPRSFRALLLSITPFSIINLPASASAESAFSHAGRRILHRLDIFAGSYGMGASSS